MKYYLEKYYMRGMFMFMIAGVLLGTAHVSQAQSWVDNNFADFASGHLEASGQDIYVSRDGTVGTIHRFDLNQDGNIDLIFDSTHDLRYNTPATVAKVTAEGKITTKKLGAFATLAVAAADFNHDGYMDLAFCPGSRGLQEGHRFVRIAWGSDEGWSNQRMSPPLPMDYPKDIAAADLNGDGWADLIVSGVNRRNNKPLVRIYWGNSEGFRLTRSSDITLPASGGVLVAGDFDGDGTKDVAVLLKNATVQLLWSTVGVQDKIAALKQTTLTLPDKATCLAAGDINGDNKLDLIADSPSGAIQIILNQGHQSWANPKQIKGLSAKDLAAGDVDGDGHVDLVLTHQNTQQKKNAAQGKNSPSGLVEVLWGSDDGFDTNNATKLSVKFPRAAAIGDLNGDGIADLAVAIYHGKKRYAAQSLIFFGEGKREFKRASSGVATSGANDVVIVPVAKGRPGRAVFCNSKGGHLLGAGLATQVYWGQSGSKPFSKDNQLDIHFVTNYQASAADLNHDGFVDLVLVNSGEGVPDDENPTLGANIFWGSANGFDPNNRTILRESFLGTSNIADLNKDGYLDLIFGSFKGKNAPVIIYYGSANGYTKKHRKQVLVPGRSLSSTTGDFNRDGWLDIAVAGYTDNAATILWGSAKGFDSKRALNLYVPECIEVETADLNGDGYLDLLASSYANPKDTDQHDMGTTIFWGSKEGFSPISAQWLPGFTPLGLTVADFDGDGYLDFFSPSYLGNGIRAPMPCYLYWGGPQGFVATRRTVLVCNSGTDALAADFNHDGLLDLAVSNHTQYANHSTHSKVFLNDGHRFANPKVIKLPTHGPHWMYLHDMGNIYDRAWQQSYTSSVFSWDKPAASGELTYEAKIPGKSHLLFQVRAAASQAALGKASWHKIISGDFTLNHSDRYLQYRAVFKSDNGDRYPILDEVRITVND